MRSELARSLMASVETWHDDLTVVNPFINKSQASTMLMGPETRGWRQAQLICSTSVLRLPVSPDTYDKENHIMEHQRYSISFTTPPMKL